MKILSVMMSSNKIGKWVRTLLGNLQENDNIKSLIKYAFLACIIGLFFMQNTTGEINWILNGQLFLFILTIVLGTLTFLTHQKEIDVVVEKEQNFRLEEERRKKIFDLKFPNIAQIPIIGTIFNWIYKEGLNYSLALIIIVLFSFFVRMFGLGDFDFREDEFLVMRAATTYHFNKEFYLWDWMNNEPTGFLYTIAWPHTWLVAKSFDIFGISEWSARLVSVIFGTVFIIISYFITKNFTDSKKIALLTTFAFALNPSYIELSRYARMYSLLLPIFLLLTYLFYRGITEGANPNSKISISIRSKPAFYFKYSFLLFGLALLYLSYFIHINVLVILPALLMFSLYLYISRREKRFFVFALSLTIMMLILILYLFTTIDLAGVLASDYFIFFNKNFYYVKYLTQYPFLTKYLFNVVIGEFGLIFSLLGFILFLLIKNKNCKDKFAYLLSFIVFTLFFFVFIAGRYPHYNYTSHITPFSITLIIVSYYYFSRLFSKKIVRILLILFLLVNVSFSFYNSVNALYLQENKYGRFTVAYETILMNFDPDKHVIIGLQLKNYYLRELGDNVNIVKMPKEKNYEFNEFINDISKYESGWITWESRKTYHLNEEIVSYVCNNFKHIHGELCGDKIDDTKVEVFYFNKTMNWSINRTLIQN